ncbi:MAG: alpha/beta fold hydrolase [Deltaproteobacteria bacterium]
MPSKIQLSDPSRFRRESSPHRSEHFVAAALLALLACRTEPALSPTPAPAPTRLTRLEGDVQLPNGAPLHYAAILAPDPLLEGAYLGTIDIPKQALSGASLERVHFVPGEHVDFELRGPGEPRWIAHYNADGSLGCQFIQGDSTLPCTMQEVIELPARVPVPALARQTPLPPFPYRVLEVKIENTAGHLVLAGTLSVPSGTGKHPAVVLVGDSDARDRDGTHARHKPYLVLADHLTRAGVAVLRLDARGVGGSGSGGPAPSASDLVSDVRAALSFSRARPEIDSRRVGLIGHGFGSVLAASTAGRDRAVAFLVLLAPPAEPGSTFEGVRCPVLALSGEEDRDASEGLPALRSALVGSPSAILDSLPGLDHQFQRRVADGTSEYGESDESFAPEALQLITSWTTHTLR